MRFSVVVVLGTLATTEIRAEVPPLDAKKLDAEAALVVTGVVMYVDVGAGTSRLDGVEYPYDLTVRVSRAKKGDAARVHLDCSREIHRAQAGIPRTAGHYALDTWDRITAVQPGLGGDAVPQTASCGHSRNRVPEWIRHPRPASLGIFSWECAFGGVGDRRDIRQRCGLSGMHIPLPLANEEMYPIRRFT